MTEQMKEKGNGLGRAGAGHVGRRGFTLPMVVMVLLIVGMLLMLLTQRMVDHALATKRQTEAYVFHHVSLGIQEAVEAWVDSNGRRSLAESLGDDGSAFELVVEGGQRVRVRFRDAQGTALGELSGLRENQAGLAAGVMVSLVEALGPERAEQLVRSDGPISVSVGSAPEPVLMAVVASVTGGNRSADLVGQLVRARETTILTEEALTGMIDAAGLEPDQANALRQMLTATPQLWEVVAEAEPLPGSVLTGKRIRYGGLAQLSAQSRTRSPQERISLERRSRFIRWRELTDDEGNGRPL